MRKIDQLLLIVVSMAVMTGGLAVLAGAFPFIPREGNQGDVMDVKFIRILSAIHAAIFIASLVASRFVSRKMYSDGLSDKIVSLFIIKFGLLEGAALVGCLIVFLAGAGKLLPDYKQFYLNYASYAYFVLEVYRSVQILIRYRGTVEIAENTDGEGD